MCAQQKLKSTCASPQSDQSSFILRMIELCILQNVPSEDSDRTAIIRRLIGILAGSTCPKVLTLRFIFQLLFFLLDIYVKCVRGYLWRGCLLTMILIIKPIYAAWILLPSSTGSTLFASPFYGTLGRNGLSVIFYCTYRRWTLMLNERCHSRKENAMKSK